MSTISSWRDQKYKLAQGWALLRGEAESSGAKASTGRPKGLGIEPEVTISEKCTTYLGCRQKTSVRPRPSGGTCTVMEYDMEEFMQQCLDSYKELAHVRDVRPVPTPFVPEDQVRSPAGAPGSGTCTECTWCCHTFPPTVYENIDALEKAKQKAKKAGRETGPTSEGGTLSEDRGKLAPVASRILMQVLWGGGRGSRGSICFEQFVI